MKRRKQKEYSELISRCCQSLDSYEICEGRDGALILLVCLLLSAHIGAKVNDPSGRCYDITIGDKDYIDLLTEVKELEEKEVIALGIALLKHKLRVQYGD